MKPFQPNKQQLEAINNGATKLWFPIEDETEFRKELIKTPLTKENRQALLKKYSPLQSNEQYFVSQKLICPGECNMGQACQCCGSNGQYIGTVELAPKSCSVKFTINDVELKHVQNLSSTEVYELNYQLSNFRAYHVDSLIFEQVHDNQYPDKPYSNNPVGFLISIERI